MRETTVPLQLVRWRYVTLNGWCERCLLPSLATVEALVAFGQVLHASRMRYLRGHWCVECDDGGTLYPVEVGDD